MAAGALLLWQKVRRFFVQRSVVDWKGERRRRECV